MQISLLLPVALMVVVVVVVSIKVVVVIGCSYQMQEKAEQNYPFITPGKRLNKKVFLSNRKKVF